MLFAQEQEIVVVQETDPWIVALTAVAVAIALASFAWTVIQGLRIHRIETREHEWQLTARKSAWIQVLKIVEPKDIYGMDGRVTSTYNEEWLRMTNTGLATARNVKWELDGGDNLPYISVHGTPTIHPGESYDLYYSVNYSTPPGWGFTVRWEDDTDEEERSNHRIIEPVDAPTQEGSS